VVVVTKYDRLARSLRDLLDIIEAIKERGAGFRSLAEDIDTTTPAERTREGLRAARKRGRSSSPSASQANEVRRMRDDEKRRIKEIAALFRVSESTVRRA